MFHKKLSSSQNTHLIEAKLLERLLKQIFAEFSSVIRLDFDSIPSFPVLFPNKRSEIGLTSNVVLAPISGRLYRSYTYAVIKPLTIASELIVTATESKVVSFFAFYA